MAKPLGQGIQHAPPDGRPAAAGYCQFLQHHVHPFVQLGVVQQQCWLAKGGLQRLQREVDDITDAEVLRASSFQLCC